MKRPIDKTPNFKPIIIEEPIQEPIQQKPVKIISKTKKSKSISTYTKTTGRLNPYW